MWSIKSTIDRYLAPAVIGEDPFNTEVILEKMDTAVKENQCAKAGVDLALWDLKGKILNLPVYALIGGLCSRKVLVDYTLSSDEPAKMAEEAGKRVQQGYSTLVVKVKGELEGDLERVRVVREAAGPDVKIRVDANQGYRVQNAVNSIRRMERYDIELFEQPVKRQDLFGMVEVAKAVDTPISADESNITLQDALHLVQLGGADILNIKIGKNGGLYNSKKIAAVAEAGGVPCLVGGMLSLEVMRQASRHFAVSTLQAQKGFASEGCGPASQTITGNITKNVVSYEDVKRLGGYIEAPSGPGLGLELDDEMVSRYLAD